MTKSIYVSTLALTIALGTLAGCSVKQARELHQVQGESSADGAGNRVEINARDFALGEMSFHNSQLFMWKRNATPTQVATVLNKNLELEDAQDELFVMGVQRKALKTAFSEVHYSFKVGEVTTVAQVDIVDYPHQVEEELPSKQGQMARFQTQLDAQRKQIADLGKQVEDLNRVQPQTDESRAQIAAITAQIADLTKQAEKNNQKIKRLQDQVAPILAAQAAVQAAGLEPRVQEWKTLEEQIASKRLQANDFLQAINESVWVYNVSPIYFDLHMRADQTIQASIHNWNLAKIDDPEIAEEGAPLDYSTDESTMGHVTYEAKGGIYSFEVYAPKSTYWFKIARTKYSARDGRVHYKGDIVRCGVEGGYGRPALLHVRDHVECGVVDSGETDVNPGHLGKAVLRRGVANLVDLDDNS